ncbi:uncharacterized protein LOC133815022 [Humulus lupulus]|uniref:uncharacterized protein LOC133815022 n=1 Tax=Humulus lupulus TaxID=3486 RepID=UPI002B40A410|nr:uncharacterized protein LOC133815022 [Humulus lupulus]
MAEQTNFHLVLAINNIKNFIPITLEMEKVQYSSWAKLFKIHCRIYQVFNHIIPPTLNSTDKTKEKTNTSTEPTLKSTDKTKEKPNIDTELWSRLDVVVLQWIYGTISNDLLHIIIKPDATTQQAWERLESLFQDNKHARALYLENQFTQVHMDAFPNVSAFCQELKIIADQLTNVDAPVSNQRLVLQLIVGLNENYDGVATILQQTSPLPPFYEARSRLILEETRKAKQAATAAKAVDNALLTNDDPKSSNCDSGNAENRHKNGPKRVSNRNNNRGKNDGGRGCGCGGSNYEGGGNNPQQRCGHQQSHSLTTYPPWENWMPWAAPPCPYPTSSWVRPPVCQVFLVVVHSKHT